MIKMLGNMAERVCLVCVADLVVKDVGLGQRFAQRHGLLIVDVVVAGAVNQHELLPPQLLCLAQNRARLVTFQVIVGGG